MTGKPWVLVQCAHVLRGEEASLPVRQPTMNMKIASLVGSRMLVAEGTVWFLADQVIDARLVGPSLTKGPRTTRIHKQP